MAQIANSHGLPFTANDADAVAAFDRTVMNYLAFSPETGGSLKALLAMEPDMPMALCLRGYFVMLMGVGGLVKRARSDADQLNKDPSRLNPRERLHAQALTGWATHSLGRATAIWREIAALYPRDILAVKMAHFGLFYLGDSRGIRDAAAAALDYWREQDDAYPYLMTMYAFGLEESGNPKEAEAIGREALARQPADPWGIHLVSHALEATGRLSEGVEFIDAAFDRWRNINNFRYHIAWHKALFKFDAGEYDDALQDYDRIIYSDGAAEYLDICNDASMLFRLELSGAEIGPRWAGVAAKVAGRTEERLLAFADLHFLLALASSADDAHNDLARRMVASMEKHGDSDAGDSAIYRAAVPAAKGIAAFREKRYHDAAETLSEALPGLHVIGGSHAQRDLFNGLLAEASWRANKDAPETVALLAARSYSHPYNRRNWEMYLGALDARGDPTVTDAARRRLAQMGGYNARH